MALHTQLPIYRTGLQLITLAHSSNSMTTTQSKPTRAAPRWSPEQDALLRKQYNHFSLAALGYLVGRTQGAVSKRVAVLGLQRSSEQAARTSLRQIAPPARSPKFDPSNPEHLAARRARERTLTAAGPVVNSNMWGDPYHCPELLPFTGRPGAMDAFAWPSRVGGTLYYRDGRVEPMQPARG